jgi:hypothetical protein
MTVQVKYNNNGEHLADVWLPGALSWHTEIAVIRSNLQRRFGVSHFDVVKVYPDDLEEETLTLKTISHQLN